MLISSPGSQYGIETTAVWNITGQLDMEVTKSVLSVKVIIIAARLKLKGFLHRKLTFDML